MSPIIKKKGEKFTLPSKYLLFILTVICVALILITFNTNFLKGSSGTVLGYVFVPFQKGITTVSTYLNDRAQELERVRELLAENEALKQQVNELTIENTTLQQDRYELTNLRELYALDAQYADYDKVGARIIAKDSGNWFHSFVIDKGAEDGITLDMNVIAGQGLVGRVVDVHDSWSKVTSIIADTSNVSGEVLATEDKLVVSGDLELYSQGYIRFAQLVDSDNAVKEGDKIVTSDISEKFLPGILIGYVSTISQDANNLTKSGTLTPAVDFEHLSEVLVILETKQVITEEDRKSTRLNSSH